jgi:formate hydrogenlyase transcriptional activator
MAPARVVSGVHDPSEGADQQERSTAPGQLHAEREHLRALLELTNAVTTRDVTSLVAAIAPNLQSIVVHDDASLFLLPPASEQMGAYALTAHGVGWTDELTAELRPDTEPFATWLAEQRTVDMDLDHFDWTGREGIRANITAAGLKRACFVPLATYRETLGFLVLNRRAAVPFAPDELKRSSQAAAQIAMALENALAFREIAALKDRLAHENIYLEEEIRGAQHFGEIVGESRVLKRILGQVSTVAATDAAVLLLGETGTGKELVARAIHAASERRTRSLVTVNCATSPAGLLESEWFGHERGAFTGALSQKIGRFELAHQGTLFLDEIGDVPLELQSKLLRALQEREIERLGSPRTIRVDFRLIAATNRDLEDMVAKREFRSDLYYRLNVFPIRIPPLRERREDIPVLVRYFTQRFAKRLRRPIESISRESMEMLCRWPWPGNVRELQNVIERAVILSQGTVMTVPRSEFESPSAPTSSPVTLEDAERDHIRRALDQTGWVIGGDHGAAARLGLKRTSLVSTMRRLGIVRPKPHAGTARAARAH